MVELAQELIDAIIDEVVVIGPRCMYPDCESLIACVVVGRTFLIPSQRRLFQVLELDSYEPDKLDEIASAFNSASHLASYVQDLVLDAAFVKPRDLTSLTRIFTRIAGLRRLWIYSRKKFHWHTLPDQSFIAAFRSLLALPPLRCFGFGCRNIPVSLMLHALSSCEEVVLLYADELDQSDAQLSFQPRDVDLPTVALNCLTLEDSSQSGAFNALMADDMAVYLRHLLYTELRILPSDFHLKNLAEKYSNTLQHIVINFGKLYDDGIDLPCMPNLAFLTLRIRVRTLRIPADLRRMLATLPECMPQLEFLTFDIDWDGDLALDPDPDKERHFAMYADYVCYREVDEALQNLPRLRKIHFRVRSEIPYEDRFVKGMAEMLPIANEAGLLSFELILGRVWDSMYNFRR